MKKTGWRRAAVWLAAGLTAALLAVLLWPGEGSRGILYRVQKGQGTLYLLGSIHVGENAMYPFGDEIQHAMEAADTFVYECDTESAEAVAETRRRMAMPEGETLRAQVGEDMYARLGEVCKQVSLTPEALDALKPWAVVNTLAVYTTAAEMGANNVRQALSLGVEKQVRAYADARGRQTAYLETLDEQLTTLEGFSVPLQEYLLQSECDVILHPDTARGMDATIASWPQWWRTGNAKAFADSYLGTYLEPGYEAVCAEYHTKLVTERNRRMANRLMKMLSQGDTRFVTVGLLHLALPDDSIVALLAEQGCSVTLLSAP